MRSKNMNYDVTRRRLLFTASLGQASYLKIYAAPNAKTVEKLTFEEQVSHPILCRGYDFLKNAVKIQYPFIYS